MVHLLQKLDGYVVPLIGKGVAFALTDGTPPTWASTPGARDAGSGYPTNISRIHHSPDLNTVRLSAVGRVAQRIEATALPQT